ncbi:MAG: hypothetical protein AAGJ69_11220, partial [Cyanobacteria bacterium J06559_1]
MHHLNHSTSIVEPGIILGVALDHGNSGRAIFVYGTLTDEITLSSVGLWLLNSLFFASAVFTIKLRKVKTSSLTGGLVYHAVGTGLVG